MAFERILNGKIKSLLRLFSLLCCYSSEQNADRGKSHWHAMQTEHLLGKCN